MFCRIVTGKLPAKIEYQDKFAVAFRDIHPKAAFHMLIVPKNHVLDVETVGDLNILASVAGVIKKFKIKNYKLVINGGNLQEVKHLHLHLMSEGGL